MEELIERMLAVCAGLAPDNRTGLIVHKSSVERDMLAVALHGQLLQIGGEALQILIVRQHGQGLGAEEIFVPDTEQTHQNGEVSLEQTGAEMHVHGGQSAKH